MLTRRDLLCTGSGVAAAMLLSQREALARGAAAARLPRFVDPLAVPPTVRAGHDGGIRMTMRPGRQRVHAALPDTAIWGFDGGEGPTWPGPTIEAARDIPLWIAQHNALGKEHLFHDSVDPATWHGPFPEFDGRELGQEQVGTPRAATHLHGARVAPGDDGFPDAWSLHGETITYRYPNRQHPLSQRAPALWYHDHAVAITRLNAYAGLSGFYLIRDPLEEELGLPVGLPYELPLMIQDRDFHEDGTQAYPAAPWVGNVQGAVAVVNGTAWPRHDVDRGVYRLRLLNAAQHRMFHLALDHGTFTVLGTDGGLLAKPVAGVRTVALAPAERLDVLVDFSSAPAGAKVRLLNVAPESNPPGPRIDEIMRFDVGQQRGHRPGLPGRLDPWFERLDPRQARVRRRMLMQRLRPDRPASTGNPWLLWYHDPTVPPGTYPAVGDGWRPGFWSDPAFVRPHAGTTEVWSISNPAPVAHPIHLHLVQFQILARHNSADRRRPAAYEGGWKDTVSIGPHETVDLVARFDLPDATPTPAPYPWHCHVLEHEDNDMMHAFTVV
ncbi:spore coat protein A [Saccharomonospora amisosensis]|uniref:Spore coat protein A n=1 Tax=Saccharomonospora amisosensis TaxID=1128677 RepID=A0A7X5US35_9PSEU|nr:multicopper oxidase domain-containing protein [Saccharomonospora amisosensis]NIJ13172.1 spore coat protein A [Saccharomonospora amisosensis]